MLKKSNSGLISVKIGPVNINNVNVTLNKVLGFSKQGSFIQIVPLKMVSSLGQVFFAAEQAASAFAGKIRLSKTPALEFLLRFTAQKQIEKALAKVKFSKGANDVAVVILARNKGEIHRAEKFLTEELNFRAQTEKQAVKTIQKNVKENFNYLKRTYAISDAELKALNDLGKVEALQNAVLEKIAMVQIEGR